MIWYLLYPIRGTTEPPVLLPSHPLRSAFARYGKYAARHVVTTLLVSVAVATILVYPFPFLYTTDFSNGASNLPHHVWTDAQPLGETSTVVPDVVMRSIWVHGSYMKALNRDVLLGALNLQDELLGPTLNFSPRRRDLELPPDEWEGDLTPQMRDSYHVINGLTNSSWFFHSPLLYWSCDAEKIRHDADIMATVNEKKTQQTSVKVHLRHSIVFSGKRFEDRRLVAADALVITLIHLRDSPVGEQWVRKAEELAQTVTDKWQVIPSDGRSLRSQLYEFQFRPLSLQDKTVLTIAYTITLLYFLLSLSKLRAVKSKLGLIVTILAQIVCSMFSSFTVCAILKVDLSRIPYFAYPLVVLAISMENSFRLINAVLATPSDQTTSSRIGLAFGETAHVAVATRLQNLLILWGLSRITFPGVAAFCSFAAIAILFDFFYLSTFFLAVLSIDVQRIELSEALDRAATARPRRQISRGPPMRKRQTWMNAVLQGRLALSTRIAGSVVILGFVLIAQWHFFNSDRFFSWPFSSGGKARNGNAGSSSLLIDIHQARSPTSWLRLQDHDTAREVIKVVKPDSHSYVALVHDPVVFVLRGSDRTPPSSERMFLPAVYDFLGHQSLPLIATVLVVSAAIRLFMNYLLFDEFASADDDEADDEPLLSVKSLNTAHTLDVVKMTATSDGKVISVALDRRICIWNIGLGDANPPYLLGAVADLGISPWPVLALAVDSQNRWLALLSSQRLYTWDLLNGRWGPWIAVDLHDQTIVQLFFGARNDHGEMPAVIIRRDGVLVELHPPSGTSREHTICDGPLVHAVPMLQRTTRGRPGFVSSVVTATRAGRLDVTTEQGSEWTSEQVVPSPVGIDKSISSVLTIPAYSAILVARRESVDLVDLQSSRTLHRFPTERMQPGSVRYTCAPRTLIQGLGTPALSSFTLAYICLDSKELILQTYLPKTADGAISFNNSWPQPDDRISLWSETRPIRRQIVNPGAWELLSPGCALGVRRTATFIGESRPIILGSTGLRQRSRGPEAKPVSRDTFEVWMIRELEKEGEGVETQPLEDDETSLGQASPLLISEFGPVVKVGTRSMAVGLGNVVKVLTNGQERFDGGQDEGHSQEHLLGVPNRRRRAGLSRGVPMAGAAAASPAPRGR